MVFLEVLSGKFEGQRIEVSGQNPLIILGALAAKGYRWTLSFTLPERDQDLDWRLAAIISADFGPDEVSKNLQILQLVREGYVSREDLRAVVATETTTV